MLPRTTIASRRALRAAGLLALGLAACGGEPSRSGAGFTGGASSLDELGRGVVEALVAADTAALASYRVTGREHAELLWPEFPVARGSDSTVAAFAWENLERLNAGAVYGLMGRYPGSGVRYAGVECPGEAKEYAGFRILEDCRVALSDPDGRRALDQPFRSVVVMNGRHKVIRYYQ